jgi:hypothetical protein
MFQAFAAMSSRSAAAKYDDSTQTGIRDDDASGWHFRSACISRVSLLTERSAACQDFEESSLQIPVLVPVPSRSAHTGIRASS